MEKIALKPCRHCAYNKGHQRLGTNDEIREVMHQLAITGNNLYCHEYSENHICANHAKKHGIKGIKADKRGDKKQHFAHMTREQMNKCGLGGIKITDGLL